MRKPRRTYVFTLWLLLLLATLAGAECEMETACCCKPQVVSCDVMAEAPAAGEQQDCGCSLESRSVPGSSAPALLTVFRVDVEVILTGLVSFKPPVLRALPTQTDRSPVEGLSPPRFDLPHPVFPNPPPAAA